MPNIEVIGFEGTDRPILLDQILAQLAELSLQDDAVVTVHDALVIDCNRRRRPYLRISSTTPLQAQYIAEQLQAIRPGLDVEFQTLEGFLPGQPPT